MKTNNNKWRDTFQKFIPENNKKVKSAAKSITFVLTEDCNMRCTYCYEHGKNPKRMSEEIALKAVDYILKTHPGDEYPGVTIDFMGGEPTLEIDLMSKIIEYFRYRAYILKHPWYKNHTFSMSSNGLLYTSDKFQEFIKKYKNSFSINISIDGNRELHDSCRLDLAGNGTYDRVLSSVKLMMKQTGILSTKATLSPDNLKYLSDSVLHLYLVGFRTINMNTVFEDGWTLDHAKLFYKELIKLADIIIDKKLYNDLYCSLFRLEIGKPNLNIDSNWCGGNGKMLAIGTDGQLYPCFRFMKFCLNGNREPFIIGNIKDGITENEKLADLESITLASQSPEECIECPVATGCAWCTGYNYDKFGTYNKRATFICWMHKARVLANYYYWSRLYEIGEIEERPSLYLPIGDIQSIMN
jgi:uncharacterized protein